MSSSEAELDCKSGQLNSLATQANITKRRVSHHPSHHCSGDAADASVAWGAFNANSRGIGTRVIIMRLDPTWWGGDFESWVEWAVQRGGQRRA